MLVLALGLLVVPAAGAATYTVDDTDDVVDAAIGDGVCDAPGADSCTVRAAIQEANFTNALDFVDVKPGTYWLEIGGIDDTAAAGDLDITKPAVITGIEGNTASTHSIQVDRAAMTPDDRVFQVFDEGTGADDASFQYLTIRGGNPAGRGGGISAERAARISAANVVIVENQAQNGGGVYLAGAHASLTGVTVSSNISSNPGFNSFGGGIYAASSFNPTELAPTLNLNISSLENNTSPNGGAGLYMGSGTATVTSTRVVGNTVTAEGAGGGISTGEAEGTETLIEGSVIMQNSATNGAGILNQGTFSLPRPRLTLRNSTVAANTDTASNPGVSFPAAVFNGGELVVEHSTLTGNVRALANNQSGQQPGTVTLAASILANSGSDDCASDDPGPFPGGGITSLGYNVIEEPGHLCTPHATDLTGQDPQLDGSVPGEDGGFTETLGLGQTSPALDLVPAASCPPPATDQRLVSRPFDGPDSDAIAECDSGAYEAIPFSVSDPTVSEGDSGTAILSFTVSRASEYGLATVNYATADGTATAGSDYTADSGTLTFQPSEFAKQVDVTISGDTAFEGLAETVLLNLSLPVNGVIADAQGTGSITEDDPEPDGDGDGHLDSSDNCPGTANANQANADGDALGDACDPDIDGDGFPNATDSCSSVSGTAGGCPDGDTDGVADTSDNCPSTANPGQADRDGDGAGDACDAPPPRPVCAGRRATRIGTAAADDIRGTRRRDVIAALGGNDVIRGLRGNDIICGGRGRDRILGGRGRDALYGQQGRDRLFGGPGRDRLFGGPGRDITRQ